MGRNLQLLCVCQSRNQKNSQQPFSQRTRRRGDAEGRPREKRQGKNRISSSQEHAEKQSFFCYFSAPLRLSVLCEKGVLVAPYPHKMTRRQKTQLFRLSVADDSGVQEGRRPEPIPAWAVRPRTSDIGDLRAVSPNPLPQYGIGPSAL